MSLQIYPNGSNTGTNTHMSVYAFIMRGEFDDTLQWPFTGRVTVDIYSYKLKKWTQIQVFNFKEYPIERGYDCVISDGSGYHLFFPQDQVETEYMFKNGSYTFVCFRVNRVELV